MLPSISVLTNTPSPALPTTVDTRHLGMRRTVSAHTCELLRHQKQNQGHPFEMGIKRHGEASIPFPRSSASRWHASSDACPWLALLRFTKPGCVLYLLCLGSRRSEAGLAALRADESSQPCHRDGNLHLCGTVMSYIKLDAENKDTREQMTCLQNNVHNALSYLPLLRSSSPPVLAQ